MAAASPPAAEDLAVVDSPSRLRRAGSERLGRSGSGSGAAVLGRNGSLTRSGSLRASLRSLSSGSPLIGRASSTEDVSALQNPESPRSPFVRRRLSGSGAASPDGSPGGSGTPGSFHRKQNLSSRWKKVKGFTLAGGLLRAQRMREETAKKFDALKSDAQDRRHLLEAARELQKFVKSVLETKKWVKQKLEIALDTHPGDLETLPIKIKSHEAFTGEVSVNRRAYDALRSSGVDLIESGNPGAARIREAIDDLDNAWDELETACEAKRKKLESAKGDVGEFNQLSSQIRDLVAWIQDEKSLIASVKLPDDVLGANTTLQEHKEHKAEIDAVQPSIQAAEAFSERLIGAQHYASDEIRAKLEGLKQDNAALHDLWQQRQREFEECKSMQVFQRDLHEIEVWLQMKEEAMMTDNIGDSLDSVNDLIKTHDDFETSLAAQEEKMRLLQEQVTAAEQSGHTSLDVFLELSAALVERRAALVEHSTRRHELLQASRLVQVYFRDLKEVEADIALKLAFANDESYKDPSNLRRQKQKFQAFEAELGASSAVIDQLNETGTELIEVMEFARDKLKIQLDALNLNWHELNKSTEVKGQRLIQASHMVEFHRNAGELEAWLDTLDTYLAAEDLGKDLAGVQLLLKKHTAVDHDYAGHKDRITAIRSQADRFVDEKYFAAFECSDRATIIVARYEDMAEPLKKRHGLLQQSLQMQQLLLDVENTMSWLKTKVPLATSEEFGTSVSSVQILDTRHKGFISELTGQKDNVEHVCAAAQKLVDDGHFAADTIREQRQALLDTWEQLERSTALRTKKLQESLAAQRYLADAHEVEQFVSSKLPIASNQDYGDTEDVAMDMLSSQKSLIDEIDAFKPTVDGLQRTCTRLVEETNLLAETVSARQEQCNKLFAELHAAATFRKVKLNESFQLHQFHREAQDMQQWLDKCFATARQEETGRSVEECEVIQKRFGDFASDFAANSERVDAVTKLAQRLVAEDHSEKESIDADSQKITAAVVELQALIDRRTAMLKDALRVLAFNRDADECRDWMAEKEAALATDDFGFDVASVAALQRRHDVLTRDLAAIERKVLEVSSAADTLMEQHPDQAEQVSEKRGQIASRWEALQANAAQRKQKLNESLEYFQFTRDFSALMEWYTGILAEINLDESARDVPDAEARVERHHEIRMQIDAHQDTVQKLLDAGDAMVVRHPRKQDVEQSLSQVAAKQEETEARWRERLEEHEQIIVIQRYLRDAAECEAWLSAHEAVVSADELGDSLDSIEALIKKHEDFEKSLAARTEQMQYIREAHDEILSGGPSAAPQPAFPRMMSFGQDKLSPRTKAFEGARRRASIDASFMARRRTTATGAVSSPLASAPQTPQASLSEGPPAWATAIDE